MQNAIKAIIAIAAATTFSLLPALGASAGPLQHGGLSGEPGIQKVDWYCGPNCRYWRHRHWEEHHWGRYGYYRPYYSHHHWHGYGYHYPDRYYRYGYAY
ncbi:MAG: hypothetical protein JOY71_27750 [Acetobacteraceae bacterium]|nr:hypothetical protein [Acetobacteraceae bacterium]MBV8525862.1 hypothetical protein [Acetobacteraceae bacterium]